MRERRAGKYGNGIEPDREREGTPGRVPLTLALARWANGSRPRPTDALPAIEAASGGSPLDAGTAARFAPALGRDLGNVRVHTGGESGEAAAALEADAFAVGNDIYFGAGRYAPGTETGDHLLAHELAHVVQHADGRMPSADGLTVSDPSDALELDAERTAQRALAPREVPPTIGLPSLPSLPATSSSAAHRFIARFTPAPAGPVTPPPAPNMQYPPGVTPEKPEKGANEHQQIGTWDDTTKISTTTTIGLYDTEAEAMAQAHTAGAVILESGRYAAYHIVTDAWFESFVYENCKVLKNSEFTKVWIKSPWLAVTTEDSVVLRPGMYNTSNAQSYMTPELMLKPGESPFAGFAAMMGKGKKLGDAELIAAFTAAMKKGAIDILAKSDVEVQKKKDQFGDKKGTSASELKLIRDTAKRLSDLDDKIAHEAFLAAGPKSASQADSDTPEKQLAREAARLRKEALEKERAIALNDYPMLARQDPKAVLGAGDEQIAKMLGDDTVQIKQDIATTRDNVLTDAIDLWTVPSIVDTTIAGCGITDPDRRKRIKDHAADVHTMNTAITIAKTAFAVGLGLLATFATGGLAVVAAAGAFGLSAYDAMSATNQYGIDKAAANTNLDPQLALVAKDMDHAWVWVLVAWVGVGLDASTVATALKGVKSIEEVARAAEQLAAGSEALLSKLRLAANIVKEGEVVSEATRGVLGLKVGVRVEIRQGLGKEIRVMYEVDRDTGRVAAKSVMVGEKALVQDILAHTDTVKLLNRYEGVTGELRELWERLCSIAKVDVKKPPSNPFPSGSQAFESWYEVEKLPKLIKSRVQALEQGSGYLTKEAEDGLRREIAILEDDLKRHRANVDRLALEKGAGYIAKGEEATKEAIAKGWPFPPPPAVPKEHMPYYYYRRDGAAYELCTMQDAPGEVKRLVLADQGGKKVILEGAPGTIQKGKMLVSGWSEDMQKAYAALEKAEEAAGAYRVVPLQGVAAVERKVGAAFTGAQKAELIDIYKRAWQAKVPGMSDAEALGKANATVNRLMEHDITLVQGTDQLRLFDYAREFKKGQTGEVIGELHHDIPLYLGGDHQMLTDIGKVPGPNGQLFDLHDELHAVLDRARFQDGLSLAPSDLAKKIPTGPGAATIGGKGGVTFYVPQGTGADMKFVPIP
jgi:hypothetical protein